MLEASRSVLLEVATTSSHRELYDQIFFRIISGSEMSHSLQPSFVCHFELFTHLNSRPLPSFLGSFVSVLAQVVCFLSVITMDRL
jgi:hypothetical protein